MPTWKSQGLQLASLECGPVKGFAEFDPDGMCFVLSRWNDQSVDSIEVLGSRGPDEQAELSVTESYVRGSDFVAELVPSGPHRITPQVYWRAAFDPTTTVVRIELVLSVRTDLLDSGPKSSVLSFAKDSELFHSSILDHVAFEDISGAGRVFDRSDLPTHLFVFRHRHLGMSYAEMVHPSDFAWAETTPDGQQPFCVRSGLFPERLEKGVIRRARVCGWFMPVENDLEKAAKLAREFVEEPLPLTA